MSQTNDMIAFESFFDNAGIDQLIETIDEGLKFYENEDADVKSIVEVDIVESLTILGDTLSDLKALSSIKKKEALGSQLTTLRHMIKAHQVLLRSYSLNRNQNFDKLSNLIHSLNIIYPLFVIGLAYEDNNKAETKEEI